ncbi:hypothetical protein RIF29_19088 [Crotalaria pallida]|uniref:E3 ubiquitin-protein ligase MARCHF6-like C-terminal domain-containing protein n=1 Tax=Crotalaria pallida TaxID=3830 RepID=A0AAN9EYX5_CROPI
MGVVCHCCEEFCTFVYLVLIGLLFELLVIVPMRILVDKSHVFLIYQDWALSLIFLKRRQQRWEERSDGDFFYENIGRMEGAHKVFGESSS